MWSADVTKKRFRGFAGEKTGTVAGLLAAALAFHVHSANGYEALVMLNRGLDQGDVDLKRRGSRLVVLVDDNAMVLLALAATFEEWGYDVLTAETADQAVERLETSGRSPDIMIVDYRLRDGRFGTEALLRIRASVGIQVPGIILTSEISADCQKEAALHGLGIALKPISSSKLHTAVEMQMKLTMTMTMRETPSGNEAAAYRDEQVTPNSELQSTT
jgi:CheY-like chemotaxis protein